MTDPSTVSEPTPDDTALLCDVMLGSLARILRMCGYDTAYALDRGVEADDRLLRIAREEDRLVLTRDVQLAERAGERGVLLRARDTDDQLRELAEHGLALALDEPERCSKCNGRVERVGDGEFPDYVPDDADPVWRCRDCGQYFWRGSHWADVRERLEDV
ncbi:Mut7-C RNAse domain-containing protein [Halospeciosus flavus]|uniref:Mut7-C RNAse domain-containing protein n=1 Tax=Halospeciosus flavus TaxID=3032283 RepID=A0ABD5Z5C3_9EURY|nr:Mut7-C RNAse domain-containing protein [Halospeciosus flavus]